MPYLLSSLLSATCQMLLAKDGDLSLHTMGSATAVFRIWDSGSGLPGDQDFRT